MAAGKSPKVMELPALPEGIPPGNLTLARRPIGFHDLPLKSADVMKIWPKNIGISPGYPMGRFLTHNENVSDPQGILKISQNQ